MSAALNVGLFVLLAVATPASGYLWWRGTRSRAAQFRWTQLVILVCVWAWIWLTTAGIHFPAVLSWLMWISFVLAGVIMTIDDQMAMRRSRRQITAMQSMLDDSHEG